MSDSSELTGLRDELIGAIDAVGDETGLEALRVSALGKKGAISERMKGLGKLDPEARKEMGQALNALKDEVGAAIAARQQTFKEAALEARLAVQALEAGVPPQLCVLEEARVDRLLEPLVGALAVAAERSDGGEAEASPAGGRSALDLIAVVLLGLVEEAAGEASGAAAELEDRRGFAETGVLDQDVEGRLFVPGLVVLLAAEGVVEGPGFGSRQHRKRF